MNYGVEVDILKLFYSKNAERMMKEIGNFRRFQDYIAKHCSLERLKGLNSQLGLCIFNSKNVKWWKRMLDIVGNARGF